MRSKLTFCAIVALASAAYAKDPRVYQTGELVQMDSVQCDISQKEAQAFAGEMPGTDSVNKTTQSALCQEYILQTERVIYRIRPRDQKHLMTLPLGDRAQFRMLKDKMLLRLEDLDSNEKEYNVVSMTPRSDSGTADGSPLHLNHLQ